MGNLTTLDYTNGIQSEIICFGDSLTAGAGAILPLLSYTGYLQNSLKSRLVINYGIGGQNSEQIACRQGAMPIYLTLTGNVLTTTDTNILSISKQFLSTAADSEQRYSSGQINGVACLITRTKVAGVESYSIRGNSGQIAPNSIFYPNTYLNSSHAVQVLWWGKNGSGSSDLLSLYSAAIDKIDSPKRVIIIGVIPSLDQIIGTANYISITAYNSTIKSAYPNNYIEITPPTILEMDFIKYVPTSQDNIDIANGVFPTGMHYDNVHLNGYGYNIIANRVAKMIKLYGW